MLLLRKFNTLAAVTKSGPSTTEVNTAPAARRSLQRLQKLFAPPASNKELGRLGDYAILALLGEGATGAVFAAEDLVHKRRLALKVLRPELAADATALQRFLRGAHSAAKLKSDYNVPIYQVDRSGDAWFLTMPLLHGEPLDRRLQRLPSLPVVSIIQIGREVAEGLAEAHALNLIHRDIKPANLWLEEMESGVRSQESEGDFCLLTPCFRVRILDFGLARPALGADNVTQRGTALGTPGYMAPEQLLNGELDGRTDLFSLGCVLYRLATAKPAFPGSSVTAVLRATLEQHPPWPHVINPAIPKAFSQLIIRLLQKDPQRRYHSARELLAAFDILHLATLRTSNKSQSREP